MNRYLVGGAVRDQLLGLPVKDRDWLVTGCSAQQLIASGYRPVGKSFEVFLHPETAEQHALPRAGKPESGELEWVSADLCHRDLTINAMAQAATGEVIDPLHGQRDLEQRILRHTPAFAEDPLRILRLARLGARFNGLGFVIAEETGALVTRLVANEALREIPAERLWNEIQRALSEAAPECFFLQLREWGALAKLMPELDRLFGVPQPARHHPEIDTGRHSLMVLQQACRLSGAAEARWAALLHDLGKGATPQVEWPRHIGHESRGEHLAEALGNRLGAPRRFTELACLAARYHCHSHRALELKPDTLMKMLERLDALRRAERFEQFLCVCEADARGRQGFESTPYPQAGYLRQVRNAAMGVDAAAIARQDPDGKTLPGRIFAARKAAVTALRARHELSKKQATAPQIDTAPFALRGKKWDK